jgi:hypothetical protein
MTIQEIAKTEEPAIELITLTIDGFEVSVPKGTLVIRAAEKLGIQITHSSIQLAHVASVSSRSRSMVASSRSHKHPAPSRSSPAWSSIRS